MIFPSSTSWITPRTTQAKLDSNNCMIILPQKIDNITKVLVNAKTIKVSMLTPPVTKAEKVKLSELYMEPSEASKIQVLDISKFVVEKSQYDCLSEINGADPTDGLCVNNAHYYEHNGYNVHLVGTTFRYGLQYFSTSAFNLAIQASFVILCEKNGGWVYWKNTNGEFQKARPYNTDNGNLSNNPMSAQFRIYYTPLGESVKLTVPKTNPQAEPFVIPYSQQQPIVDSVTHGREMQSITNRMGCETKEVVRTFPGIKHYRSPHDHWFYREKDADGNPTGNVWRLTSATLSVVGGDDKTNCHVYRSQEVWSKNWSYRSPNVPINREFRSWNIPADIVQRNLLWQDYCLLTKKSVTLPDNALLSDWAKKQLMNTLAAYKDAESARNEMSVLWFYTKDGDNRKGVALTCSAFGFGNSLVFSGKTKDNLSAGVQRVKSDDGDENYQEVRPWWKQIFRTEPLCFSKAAWGKLHRACDRSGA